MPLIQLKNDFLNTLPPFRVHDKHSFPIEHYLSAYDLPYSEQLQYAYGYHFFNDVPIFSQCFTPVNARGSVFLLHGYMDHSASFYRLITALTARHLRVICYDLPGHGLSGGTAGHIKDFNTYTALLYHQQTQFKQHTSHQPTFIIAHSTGCIAAIQSLFENTQPTNITCTYLISPLVRCTHWWLVKLRYHLARWFKQRIPRGPITSCYNTDFLERLQQDSLQGQWISFDWLKALFQWEKSFKKKRTHPSHAPVLVFQGIEDNVVDWAYNHAFLKTCFSQWDCHYFPGAHHHLLNELQITRNQVMQILFDHLDVRIKSF